LKLVESFEAFKGGTVCLSANLVPHERFHLCDWWRIGNCDWWWWSRRNTPNLAIDSISDIDEELRGIVSSLWRNRIPTTPSCSGHSDFGDRRDSIHSSIIQTMRSSPLRCYRGGTHIDIDSIEDLDPDWYDRIVDYQRRGVLGWKKQGWEDSIDWPSQTMSDRGCFFLLTETSEEWKRLEEIIKSKLNEENPGYPGQAAPLSTQLHLQIAPPSIVL
jgi:hypothetical protein